MIPTLARSLSDLITQTQLNMLLTQVVLDGNDLKSLNVGWLRDNIGIVGQEPGQHRSEMEMMLLVLGSYQLHKSYNFLP